MVVVALQGAAPNGAGLGVLLTAAHRDTDPTGHQPETRGDGLRLGRGIVLFASLWQPEAAVPHPWRPPRTGNGALST